MWFCRRITQILTSVPLHRCCLRLSGIFCFFNFRCPCWARTRAISLFTCLSLSVSFSLSLCPLSVALSPLTSRLLIFSLLAFLPVTLSPGTFSPCAFPSYTFLGFSVLDTLPQNNVSQLLSRSSWCHPRLSIFLFNTAIQESGDTDRHEHLTYPSPNPGFQLAVSSISFWGHLSFSRSLVFSLILSQPALESCVLV